MMTIDAESDRYKLVEESSGAGAVLLDQDEIRVQYTIKRFQGMTRAGLPVPGVHRIEGVIRLDSGALPEGLVGRSCSLNLGDGRILRVTLIDTDGRILAEGHGPSRCSCC